MLQCNALGELSMAKRDFNAADKAASQAPQTSEPPPSATAWSGTTPFDEIFSAMLSPAAYGPLGDMVQQWCELLPPQSLTPLATPEQADLWTEITGTLQNRWVEFQREQAASLAQIPHMFGMPPALQQTLSSWLDHLPAVQPDAQTALWTEGYALWEGIIAAAGAGSDGQAQPPAFFPRSDKRFADAKWRETPYFALIHQLYLLLAEKVTAMTDSIEGLEPDRKAQLQFNTRAMLEAMSPDHFPLTNPLVLERALETRGDSLLKGFEHLLEDMRRGQLSHTDAQAFSLGKNIATTPGKVVYRGKLFELIQYTATTPQVLATPLLIFPPWINRYYILDLNPKKSLVQWALDQGISVFLVSWKPARAHDEAVDWGQIAWDDYIGAQIEAIDVVRNRLTVPSVHTIGYCVAGTTLAATLAILARRGDAAKVASATFFTAQVDFEKAGELKAFVDDQQLAAIATLAPDGVLDGRYLAATFNLLRSRDLIWNYVRQNYLLGEDYPAFDLLYWNGDTTNLPAGWHLSYLRDLYRDNRLVVPDSLEACGTPIDLTQITTPCYIQAGREDHIAPPESVWRLTRHLPQAPWTFVLAGSGHIAGVVNPPAAKKYQYWTNDQPSETLAQFAAGAQETAGSWWPHWAAWLRHLGAEVVDTDGLRVPGSAATDAVLCDAPGEFVRLH
jgi:polyhydroxyalkanoate synthase